MPSSTQKLPRRSSASISRWRLTPITDATDNRGGYSMKKLVMLATAALMLWAVPKPATAGPTLDRILKEKKLVVGVAPWNRFVAINPQTQKFEGYIADDIYNLEAMTGIKVEFVNTSWSGLIAGLQAGKWDVIMTGMGATPERAT